MSILNELNVKVETLKGVGKRAVSILNRANIHSIGELLQYFPRKFSDRTKTCTLEEAVNRPESTVVAMVVDYRMIGRGYRKFLKILINDGSNYGALICFNRNFLKNSLKMGEKYYITGKFSFNYGEYQCSNFEYEELSDNYTPRLVPLYPLISGMTQKLIRNSVEYSLQKYYNSIENDLPARLIAKRGLLNKKDVIKNLRYPDSLERFFHAKKSFIYEEFFFQQLFLLNRKNKISNISKSRKSVKFDYKNKVLSALPFKLTEYQEKALEEIEKDLFSRKVMSRLAQGDVGCGKTIVALLSILSVIESGEQTAYMAPTEVLARQHYDNIKRICSVVDVKIGFLTGNVQKKERETVLSDLANGEIDLIVGTHSLFSKDAVYKNLGYVVIDEQQRFGVEQRLNLSSKGEQVDILLMTATPIPQSLALALYGDLELTIMKGKISGRIPVKTWVIDDDEERLKKMRRWLKNILLENGRGIFVYSQIEEGDNSELKNLEEEYSKLSKEFSQFGTGIIHSRMTSAAKDEIIEKFRRGEYKILAATTVVEVGLDIPDANVIVVENAERYGLSTLHQLRGRVGRNNREAYMILISKFSDLSEEGKKRLEIIKNSTDGFAIAEQDLELRGPGDFLGTKQSGLPKFKYADLKTDFEILKDAKNDAEDIFSNDPNLEKTENINTKKAFLERLKFKANI